MATISLSVPRGGSDFFKLIVLLRVIPDSLNFIGTACGSERG
jgi:hypothetical protein